jgi:hypothetical protein
MAACLLHRELTAIRKWEGDFSLSNGEKRSLLSNEICESSKLAAGVNSVAGIYITKCISGSNPEGAEILLAILERSWNYFITNSTEIRRRKETMLEKLNQIPNGIVKHCCDGFGGLVVRMLASGSRVRGFKPGRIRWIFLCIKILSLPSVGREVK